MNVRLTQLDKTKFLQDIQSAMAQMHQTRNTLQDTQSTTTQVHQTASDTPQNTQSTMSQPSQTETEPDVPGVSAGKPRPVHFILDEVYSEFQPVFDVILENFPQSEVWTAGESVNGR